MRRKTLRAATLALLIGAAGCSQNREARYVYRDGNYGVIGIARDTKAARREADRLMTRHFPDGFDVVREEEIETGSRKADQLTKRNSSIKPGAGMSQFLIGVGGASAENESKFVDDVKLHEVRIIYRNRQSGSQEGFTATASITPEMYSDPNRKSRAVGEEKLLATAGPAPDAEVRPASKSD